MIDRIHIASELLKASREVSSATSSDREYLDSIERGDMAAAQKMVDEAAKRAGFDTVAFKGMLARNWRTGEKINILRSANGDWAGFFSDDQGVADKFRRVFSTMGEARLLKVYLDMTDATVIDANGKHARDFQADALTVERRNNALLQAILSNKSGVVIANTADEGNVFIPRRSSQIKSADPVTYDDDGNVILLSNRFGAGDDIRGQKTTVIPVDDFPVLKVLEDDPKMSEKLKSLRSVLPGLRSKGNKTLKQMGIEGPIMPNAKVEEIVDALLLVAGGRGKTAGYGNQSKMEDKDMREKTVVSELMRIAALVGDVEAIDVSLIEPEKKDIERAEGLDFRGSTFYGNGAPFASSASKMAKLIKDPEKLARRAMAVLKVWGSRSYYGMSGGVKIEENVWIPFKEALFAMGFTRQQVYDIESKWDKGERRR